MTKAKRYTESPDPCGDVVKKQLIKQVETIGISPHFWVFLPLRYANEGWGPTRQGRYLRRIEMGGVFFLFEDTQRDLYLRNEKRNRWFMLHLGYGKNVNKFFSSVAQVIYDAESMDISLIIKLAWNFKLFKKVSHVYV